MDITYPKPPKRNYDGYTFFTMRPMAMSLKHQIRLAFRERIPKEIEDKEKIYNQP
jgi:hypothetical protein